jgi:hypothetical protein
VKEHGWYVPYLLLFVGSLSSLGYAFGFQSLQGLGFTSVASPLPLMFTEFRGEEIFAQDLTIRLKMQTGSIWEYPESKPESDPGRMLLRNPYASVLTVAGYLTNDRERRLVDAVVSYGFCQPADLLSGLSARNLVGERVLAVDIIHNRRLPDKSKTASVETAFHHTCRDL